MKEGEFQVLLQGPKYITIKVVTVRSSFWRPFGERSKNCTVEIARNNSVDVTRDFQTVYFCPCLSWPPPLSTDYVLEGYIENYHKFYTTCDFFVGLIEFGQSEKVFFSRSKTFENF